MWVPTSRGQRPLPGVVWVDQGETGTPGRCPTVDLPGWEAELCREVHQLRLARWLKDSERLLKSFNRS